MKTFAFAYNSVTTTQALQCLPFVAARCDELASLAPTWTQSTEILDRKARLPELIEEWLLTPGGLAQPGRREFLEQLLLWLPPQITGVLTNICSLTGEQIRGYLISTWLLPEQYHALSSNLVADKILRLGRMAEGVGASVLGLGAFTSIFPPGIPLLLQEKLDLTVTSGNCLTAAVAIQGIEVAASRMGIDMGSCRIAVVGATGSIGGVCAEILAERTNSSLTLVGRTVERLKVKAERISQLIGRPVHVTTDLSAALAEADVVLFATNSAAALVAPHMLATGAVVCDVSVPRNVSREVAQARDDVLVMDGGLMEVPGAFTLDSMHPYFGLPARTAYACAAETMLLTLEDEKTRGLEIINPSRARVQHMLGVARKHGFGLAQLRSFGEAVTENDLHLRMAKSTFRRRITQLSFLEELSEAVEDTDHLDALLERVLTQMLVLFKAEAASIWLLNAAGDEIRCAASVGPDSKRIFDFRLPRGKGVVGQVINSAVGVIVPHVASHEGFESSADRFTGFRTHSMLCSPLTSKRGTLGAIQVLNPQGAGKCFTGQDLALLSLLGRHVAIAVRNRALVDRAPEPSTPFVDPTEFLDRTNREIGRARRHKIESALLVIRLGQVPSGPGENHELSQVQALLNAELRREDFFTRLTDSELAVFLPHTAPSRAEFAVARMRQEIAEQLREAVNASSLLFTLCGIGPTTTCTAVDAIAQARNASPLRQASRVTGGA